MMSNCELNLPLILRTEVRLKIPLYYLKTVGNIEEEAVEEVAKFN